MLTINRMPTDDYYRRVLAAPTTARQLCRAVTANDASEDAAGTCEELNTLRRVIGESDGLEELITVQNIRQSSIVNH